ncbi:MAG: hypothetical protein ABIP35_02735 [Ginsengibacter sp.]
MSGEGVSKLGIKTNRYPDGFAIRLLQHEILERGQEYLLVKQQRRQFYKST